MKNNYVLLITALLAIASCKKHLGDDHPTPPGRPHPAMDSTRIDINKEIASILEQVYTNDSAYQEVNAAIASEFYADERVLLKDLLFPEYSELYSTKKFLDRGVIPGVFRRKFNEVLLNGQYPLISQALGKESPAIPVAATMVMANEVNMEGATVLFGESAAAIYFPYSSNFINPATSVAAGSIVHATIVAADREADAAPGRAPFSCGTGRDLVCYKDVTVNDGYADSLPTHIATNGAVRKTIPTATDTAANSVARVYLGWAKLTRQMDALISFTGNGGGSEIKIARLSGYLKEDGQQVTSFSGDLVSLDFSRSDIRNQQWKKVYSVWDPNWSKDNLEQVFAVYEDDTKGTKTFSGSLSTTVSLPGTPATVKGDGEVAYKVEVSTQDDIITERKYDRLSFFRDGRNSQGWGFFNDPGDFLPANYDWPIFDGGAIWQYTIPWRMS